MFLFLSPIGPHSLALPQVPVSRTEQFAGKPEQDADLESESGSKPKRRGKGRGKGNGKGKGKGKKTKQNGKGKSKKGSGKGQSKKGGKPRASSKKAAQKPKGETEPPSTPVRPKVNRDKNEGSRSKQTKKNKNQDQKRKEHATREPSAKRASKGEAVSFARRNPPDGERAHAEWSAIRSAYRASLSHLLPQAKHEDYMGNLFYNVDVLIPEKTPVNILEL